MKENEVLTMPGYSRRAAISGALAAAGGAAVFGNSVSGAPQKKKDTRSTSPKKVVLTQTQVNLAKRLGVPLEDYAKQVAIETRKNANG